MKRKFNIENSIILFSLALMMFLLSFNLLQVVYAKEKEENVCVIDTQEVIFYEYSPMKKYNNELTKVNYVYEDPYRVIEKEPENLYTFKDFEKLGIVDWEIYRFTWYSEQVLPGQKLDIPGRYTDTDGFVKDKDGYIVAATLGGEQGAIYPTPFGLYAKTYDYCATCEVGQIDLYVK